VEPSGQEPTRMQEHLVLPIAVSRFFCYVSVTLAR
jgi:hypothetical protein